MGKKAKRILFGVFFVPAVVASALILGAFLALISASSPGETMKTEMKGYVEALDSEGIVDKNSVDEYTVLEYAYDGSSSVFSFEYCELDFELSLYDLVDEYNIELEICSANLECLTEAQKNGVERVLNLTNQYFETDVFSSDKVLANYKGEYFQTAYDEKSYELTSEYFLRKYEKMDTSRLCSYKSTDDRGSYIYRAGKNQDSVFLCEIAIVFCREG